MLSDLATKEIGIISEELNKYSHHPEVLSNAQTHELEFINCKKNKLLRDRMDKFYTIWQKNTIANGNKMIPISSSAQLGAVNKRKPTANTSNRLDTQSGNRVFSNSK